jgi:hypothetical protein
MHWRVMTGMQGNIDLIRKFRTEESKGIMLLVENLFPDSLPKSISKLGAAPIGVDLPIALH